uniref:Uncharacterized protein n=1 Tax=Neolamprologus brichardi TaxID=32507 RepID=A0A3Q4H1Z8_NEOBR
MLVTFFLLVFAGVWSENKLEQSNSEVKRPGERVKMLCTLSGYRLTTCTKTIFLDLLLLLAAIYVYV